MTFDDIIASDHLLDGVWDTQRFTRAIDDAMSAATQKKIERSLADRELLFPVASNETVSDEHERTGKQSVVKSILERAKAKRQRVLFMASHESNGLNYLGFNDGRSVRQWIFSKDAIDYLAVGQALEIPSKDEGRDLLIIPTGPVVVPCR